MEEIKKQEEITGIDENASTESTTKEITTKEITTTESPAAETAPENSTPVAETTPAAETAPEEATAGEIAPEEASAKKKGKKVKKPFRLADKHPFFGVILEILFALLWVSGIIPVIGSTIMRVVVRVNGMDSDTFVNAFNAVISIIAAIIFLLYHRKRMGKEYTGYFGGENKVFGFKLMIPWVAYWVIMSVVVAICSKFGLPEPIVVLLALQAGIVEESLFRIVPLTFAMRHRSNRKMIMYSVIVTSVIFGLIHMANVKVGAPLDLSIFQVVAASMMGLFMAACFIRTGNVLFSIVPHFINDIIAGTDLGLVGDELIMSGGLKPYNFVDLGITIFIGLFGLYLIRPSKQDEIVALWDKKLGGA